MEHAGENFAISSNRNELMNKYKRFQKALDIAKLALVELAIEKHMERRGDSKWLYVLYKMIQHRQ
jgi:hypothetical protein